MGFEKDWERDMAQYEEENEVIDARLVNARKKRELREALGPDWKSQLKDLGVKGAKTLGKARVNRDALESLHDLGGSNVNMRNMNDPRTLGRR